MLSFFKENEIDYVFHKHDLIFSCFQCNKEANMDVATSYWHCINCHSKGNLKELIENKELFKRGINLYNPKKEKNELLGKLKQLISKQDDDKLKKQLESVYEKTYTLTNYLLNEKESI